MTELISLVVSDRNEMEGVAGLHAEVLLKRGTTGRTFVIVGTATFSDEMKIGTVTIVEDALGLGSERATALIRAACCACWNAVVINGLAMSGLKWRPLRPWLDQFDASVSELARTIETMLGGR